MTAADPTCPYAGLADPSPADVVVEALALTSHVDDPFAQAAAVTEYLWDHGLIIKRADHSLAVTTIRAFLWSSLGGFLAIASYAGLHKYDELYLAWASVAIISALMAVAYARRHSSMAVFYNHEGPG